MSYWDFIDPLNLMHGKENSSSSPSAQQARIVNPGKSYLLTDKEKKYYSGLEDLLYGSIQGTQGVINNGNINREQYFHDLYDPAKKELTNIYDKNLGQTKLNANTLGTAGSLGFENYRANKLDKNYTDSLSNLESTARMQSYDLPNKLMQPYITAGNFSGSELTNTRNRKYTEFLPALQRAQLLTSGNVSNASMVNELYKQQMVNELEQQKKQSQQQGQMQQAMMLLAQNPELLALI
ncbi:MAG: hypothetical protein U9P90_02305 [Patescibacteria group bacterium]|nr:hypothetical protein [Patescibacteria group bacterium]